MLQPRKQKYRKSFNPNMGGKATRGCKVTAGEFGLQSLDRSWLTARQIESARKAIVRETKRRGKLWLKVFPDVPVTAHAAETRMGGGKGDVDHYILAVKPGRIIFELGGVDEKIAKEAFRKAAQKLPVLTRFVIKTI
ncbi:50S ribosomal protein L16 [Candidatus Dojkabacteria bacterium]|nr:50S ribosomal protein L16 [Candidatus Dojkabacteria bacterium]